MKTVEYWTAVYHTDAWHIDKEFLMSENYNNLPTFKNVGEFKKSLKKIDNTIPRHNSLPDVAKIGKTYYQMTQYDLAGETLMYAGLTNNGNSISGSVITVYNTKRYDKSVKYPYKDMLIKEETHYGLKEEQELTQFLVGNANNQHLIFSIKEVGE